MKGRLVTSRRRQQYQALLCEERRDLLTEIEAAEGRLGLTNELARLTFYGPIYPTPEERLARLLQAEMRIREA